MIGFYDYTVIATYLATVLGVGGIFLAADGLHLPAVFCLLLAGLLDTFDGRIARTKKDRSEQQKHFGIQIDSLNDLICFGVLPAMICRGAYAASPAYLSLGGPVGRILPPVWFDAALCFFVLAGLIRLGVSREIAAADACKIEHDISDETFHAIKSHLNRLAEWEKRDEER